MIEGRARGLWRDCGDVRTMHRMSNQFWRGPAVCWGPCTKLPLLQTGCGWLQRIDLARNHSKKTDGRFWTDRWVHSSRRRCRCRRSELSSCLDTAAMVCAAATASS
ncbi:hypothetical protein ACK3TF_000650 [Chlorella vulgaris]